jgi:hypothetical protein
MASDKGNLHWKNHHLKEISASGDQATYISFFLLKFPL